MEKLKCFESLQHLDESDKEIVKLGTRPKYGESKRNAEKNYHFLIGRRLNSPKFKSADAKQTIHHNRRLLCAVHCGQFEHPFHLVMPHEAQGGRIDFRDVQKDGRSFLWTHLNGKP